MSEVSTLLLAFSLLVLATTPPLLVVGRLTAAPQRDDAGVLSFVVVGDWGGSSSKPYYTGAEKDVAKQMGETATQIGSRFTVALGDNFYENGVKDVDDPRFSETFENIFTASSLQSRWYVICGNHDHYGNASAQVAYTSHSKRWFMPDLYYNEVVTIPGTSSTVEFVFIDTVILCGLSDPQLRSLPPSGPKSPALADEQWTWIEDTLSKSKADWIIVAGHYPVWSIAEHGPTQLLVERLRPLLTKYNVSAYFCGHDHNLQHIQENGSSVNYFVSGAGHLLDASQKHKNDIPAGSLKFEYTKLDLFDKHGGYTSVSFDTEAMNVAFYDSKGKKLYSVVRPKIRLL